MGRAVDIHDGAEGRIEVAPGISVWYRAVGSGPDVVIVPTAGNSRDLDGLAASRPDRPLLRRPRPRSLRSGRRGRRRLQRGGRRPRDRPPSVRDRGVQRGRVLVPRRHRRLPRARRTPAPPDRLVLVSVDPGPGQRPAGTGPRARAAPGRAPRPARGGRPADVRSRRPVPGLARGVRAAADGPPRRVRAAHAGLRPARTSTRGPSPDRSCTCSPSSRPTTGGRTLRGLDVPTLVVHGSEDHDPVEHAIEWVDALPDARLLELDGIGQLPVGRGPATLLRRRRPLPRRRTHLSAADGSKPVARGVVGPPALAGVPTPRDLIVTRAPDRSEGVAVGARPLPSTPARLPWIPSSTRRRPTRRAARRRHPPLTRAASRPSRPEAAEVLSRLANLIDESR